MHPAVFALFDDTCARRGAGGAVLEIGARPAADTLLQLPALRGARSRVGIDLDGPHDGPGFRILRANAHAMTAFADRSFDTIVCNSVLEHDARFWLTLGEVRRVARPGALVVFGVPAFGEAGGGAGHAVKRLAEAGLGARALTAALARTGRVGRAGRQVLDELAASTPTLVTHEGPGDFYRFSRQAVREVLCEGMLDVEIARCLVPPRLVAAGRMP